MPYGDMQTKSKREDIASTQMLKTRLAANKRASRDFDEWCLRQFPELPMPSRIMDLGCGTGKQILLFSPLISPRSQIWGLDLSGESLQRLTKKYSAKAELKLLEGSFDQLESFPDLHDEQFDLIYGSYALYYTHDLPRLVTHIYRFLKPGGIFWVIAPYTGTNDEFLRIIRKYHEVEAFMDYVFDQFHVEVIEMGEKVGFKHLKPSLLRNRISFPDSSSFMDYLSHSLFYRPGFDQAIKKEVDAIVDAKGEFSLSKHIISLQLRK